MLPRRSICLLSHNSVWMLTMSHLTESRGGAESEFLCIIIRLH